MKLNMEEGYIEGAKLPDVCPHCKGSGYDPDWKRPSLKRDAKREDNYVLQELHAYMKEKG